MVYPVSAISVQPANYLSIISQVAQSVHSPKEIAANLDLEPATVSAYLHTLVKLGLVRREAPATERQPERSRKSRYEVADPYLRFYYRFLELQLAHITRGAYSAVWRTIERHWRATEQIDVVAVNWDEGVVLYGECKWKRDNPLNEAEVKKLFKRTEQIGLTTRSGNLLQRQHVFFSRSGFSDPARALAQGAILVNLAYLDEVLAAAVR